MNDFRPPPPPPKPPSPPPGCRQPPPRSRSPPPPPPPPPPPRSRNFTVFRELHHTHLLRHRGLNAAASAIRDRFYWPGRGHWECIVFPDESPPLQQLQCMSSVPVALCACPASPASILPATRRFTGVGDFALAGGNSGSARELVASSGLPLVPSLPLDGSGGRPRSAAAAGCGRSHSRRCRRCTTCRRWK
eukprot:SAG22_NODE_453_length_10316_cov_27.583341_6_plen_190_part_00